MPFSVLLTPGGARFEAREDEPVLDAALRQGHVLSYSCRNGSCGSCKARLVSGQVDYGEYQDRALSLAEKQQGYALLCQAAARTDLVIEARELAAVADIPVRMLPCRVAEMRRLAHDVMELRLKLPQGQRLQYLAGQYIDVLLKDGQRRSFSIAVAPHRDALLQLHIRHVPGGLFTGHVFNGLSEKDLLRFRGPMGTFFLREDSPRPVVLMAGGTGFAPIKAIIEQALAAGLSRPMHLFWGVRARRDLYHHDLAMHWAAQGAVRYTPVMSEPQAADAWRGVTGWVHDAVIAEYPDLSGVDVYAGGPPPMIEAAKTVFTAAGLPAGQLFFDSFEFATDPAGAKRETGPD